MPGKINKMLRELFAICREGRNNCFAAAPAATPAIYVCLIYHANILYLNIP